MRTTASKSPGSPAPALVAEEADQRLGEEDVGGGEEQHRRGVEPHRDPGRLDRAVPTPASRGSARRAWTPQRPSPRPQKSANVSRRSPMPNAAWAAVRSAAGRRPRRRTSGGRGTGPSARATARSPGRRSRRICHCVLPAEREAAQPQAREARARAGAKAGSTRDAARDHGRPGGADDAHAGEPQPAEHPPDAEHDVEDVRADQQRPSARVLLPAARIAPVTWSSRNIVTVPRLMTSR